MWGGFLVIAILFISMYFIINGIVPGIVSLSETIGYNWASINHYKIIIIVWFLSRRWWKGRRWVRCWWWVKLLKIWWWRSIQGFIYDSSGFIWTWSFVTFDSFHFARVFRTNKVSLLVNQINTKSKQTPL